ncbi:HAD family hydrolase [Magnetovibrio sp.]|uniref:HAD family hydrolase n=1 Tax=Magnetovibrio sp. TaxID=2024836 RepID=UPI002F93538E
MKHVQALFLDFDGVLVESVEIKSKAFKAIYADQPADVLAHIMAYHGAHDGISRVVKLRHCHEHFLGKRLNQDELDALTLRYAQLVEDAVVDAPWVLGALELLQSHHKICKLFVVSGTPDDEIKRIAQRRAMMGWLTSVHGSPTSKTDIVRALAATHGLNPNDCVFIGDAMADWTAAHETGIAFIGRVATNRPSPFPQGTHTVPDLRGLTFV